MRSSASRNTVTGAPKRRSRLPNLSERDRDDLTQNLGSRLIDIDPVATNLALKTPEAGFQATAAYLLANPPPANTPQAAGYNNAIAGLGLVKQTLPGSGGHPNIPAPEPRRQNRASPRRGESPPRRNSPRRDAPAHRADVHEARNDITQGRVDRAREERAQRNDGDRDNNEAFGLRCFSRTIRQARVPEKFKLPHDTVKYDGTQDPRTWIEDYLATVKLHYGTRDTAMQFIQLHLKESARAWLRSLPEESIDHWNDLVRLFVANFQATCKRPGSIEELRACVQRWTESLREYMQRWTLLKNTCENINQELIIDAFKRGLLRRDLREELGRLKPKTVGRLMEIVNDWADGEDSVQRPWGDAPDDDDDPRDSRFERNGDRRQKRKNREMSGLFVDTTNQVAGAFPRRDDGNRDTGAPQGQRYLGTAEGRGPRPRHEWQPRQDEGTSAAQQLASPCHIHSYVDKEGVRRSI